MESDHIRLFFSNEENWKKVVAICHRQFPKGYDAEDVAQDLAEKLLKYNGESHFPKDYDGQVKFITRMVMNYYLDYIENEKKKFPTVDESILWNMGEVEMPEKTDKLIRLNELILQKSYLFTEEQLKLWKCMFERMTVKQMMKALNKNRQNIYSQSALLRARIRKHFKWKDLE